MLILGAGDAVETLLYKSNLSVKIRATKQEILGKLVGNVSLVNGGQVRMNSVR